MLGLGQPVERLAHEFGSGLGLVIVVVLDLVDGVGGGLLHLAHATNA